MNSGNFEKELLEKKKELFIKEVIRATLALKIALPSVNFDLKNCPDNYDSPDTLAHYHPANNLICCYEKTLKNTDIDTLKHIAFHEVTHALEPNHESKFYNKLETTVSSSWRPPGGGIAWIDGTGNTTEEWRKRYIPPTKINKNKCFSGCNNKERFNKCNYCGFYFCEEHITPREPNVHNLRSNKSLYEIATQIDPEKSHPCADYAEYLFFKEKETLTYEQMLGKESPTKKNTQKSNIIHTTLIKEHKSIDNDDKTLRSRYNTTETPPEGPKGEKPEIKPEPPHNWLKDLLTKKMIIIEVIIILLLIGLIGYQFYLKHQEPTNKILKENSVVNFSNTSQTPHYDIIKKNYTSLIQEILETNQYDNKEVTITGGYTFSQDSSWNGYITDNQGLKLPFTHTNRGFNEAKKYSYTGIIILNITQGIKYMTITKSIDEIP